MISLDSLTAKSDPINLINLDISLWVLVLVS